MVSSVTGRNGLTGLRFVLCVFERCAVLDLSVVWGNCEGIMKRPVFRLADDQVHLQAANSGSYKDTSLALKDPPEVVLLCHCKY